MATRYGAQYANELADKGWIIVSLSDTEFRCGDPRVIDPVTGKEHSPYEAREIQAQRDTEQT